MRRHVRRTPSRWLARGLALAVACGMAPVAVAVHAQAPLAERVLPRLREFGIPGMTWALVRGDEVMLGAAGVRDVATGAAITPDARMQVGSVTKVALATGVLQLVTRGLLRLDAPIAEYLPELSIDNPWAATSPIRVRHLLDHTSGLGDAHLWQVFSQRMSPDLPLLEAIARPGTHLAVQAEPGTRFSYSNTGYTLLALLIEARTGARYEPYLDRELLHPLGMTRSTFTWQTQAGPGADTAMAMGHFEGGVRHPSYALAARPASQFTTTAGDMARLARFLMSNGRVGDRVLVDSALLAAMGQPTTTLAARTGLTSGYGLGLQGRERWGVMARCHQGNSGTFRAVLCLVPGEQRAFFASYTSDPEGVVWDRVDSLLMRELAPAPMPVPTGGTMTPGAEAWDGWYAPRPTRFEQFAYLDALGALVRVHVRGDTMTFAPLGGAVRTLVGHAGRQWRLTERLSPSHVLLEDGRRRLISDGQRTLERVSTPLVWVRWLGALLGMVTVIGVLVRGALRLLRPRAGDARWRDPAVWPTIAALPLLAGGAGLTQQPFLAIGDPTLPSMLLAAGTGGLLVAIVASTAALVVAWRADGTWTSRRWWMEGVALVGALQWLLTLAAWGLVPLRLWG